MCIVADRRMTNYYYYLRWPWTAIKTDAEFLPRRP